MAMTVDRPDKGTDSKPRKPVPLRADNKNSDEMPVDEMPVDEMAESLKLVSTRLRKKLMVRRAIWENRTPRDGASRDRPTRSNGPSSDNLRR